MQNGLLPAVLISSLELSMSLRIKLPALKPPPPSTLTAADMEWSEQASRKRKRPRPLRYVGSDDDLVDESEDEHEQDDQRSENDSSLPDPKLTTKSSKGKGKASANTSGKGGAIKQKAKADNTAPPKKQKLPTIKKVKLPTLNTPTSTIDTVVLPLGSKPTQDGVRKTLIGTTTDIDLSNKSIYEEIFSKTGQGDGGMPRAGSNRRTKEEERRKELNQQRDEAKAKRALAAGQTFDLQFQFDRISRFEEKLKAEHSSALYPNFLAAKWREDWEKEKRRQKGKNWHDSVYSHESTTREEGEVR